jgi:hypothetical protein
MGIQGLEPTVKDEGGWLQTWTSCKGYAGGAGREITHRVVWRQDNGLWAVAWFVERHGSIRLEISEFAACKMDRSRV